MSEVCVQTGGSDKPEDILSMVEKDIRSLDTPVARSFNLQNTVQLRLEKDSRGRFEVYRISLLHPAQ